MACSRPPMSDPLRDDQRRELHALLEREQAALLGRVGAPAIAEDATEPGDSQDHAADEVEMRDALALSDHARERLREIEAALARMADGTYGVCEETGEPIPFERLRAEPTTRYTVEVLELLEEERAHEGADPSDDTAY